MTVIELQVAPGDLGRVIGRQGRTAAAVRTLLSAAAEAEGKRATLDIRDANERCSAPPGGEDIEGLEGVQVTALNWDDMVLVGFIARTHGNKGQVILKSETRLSRVAVSRGGNAVCAVGHGAGREARR